MIVFFLLGISESILTHRNGPFPAAKMHPGHKIIFNSPFPATKLQSRYNNILKERINLTGPPVVKIDYLAAI
ncbi:8560_t:CDS:2, partial [Racocetra persica]